MKFWIFAFLRTFHWQFQRTLLYYSKTTWFDVLKRKGYNEPGTALSEARAHTRAPQVGREHGDSRAPEEPPVRQYVRPPDPSDETKAKLQNEAR